MTTLQAINIGNLVNDGTGDNLRTAFDKVNQNFTALNSAITVTAANVGQTGVGVYKDKNGSVLEFKNLVAGTNIQLTPSDNSIVISNAAGAAFQRIDTMSGTILAQTFAQLTFQGITDTATGLHNVDVTAFGSTIKFDTTVPINRIVKTFDFGPIAGSFMYTEQLALAFANIDFGTAMTPSGTNLDLGSITGL